MLIEPVIQDDAPPSPNIAMMSTFRQICGALFSSLGMPPSARKISSPHGKLALSISFSSTGSSDCSLRALQLYLESFGSPSSPKGVGFRKRGVVHARILSSSASLGTRNEACEIAWFLRTWIRKCMFAFFPTGRSRLIRLETCYFCGLASSASLEGKDKLSNLCMQLQKVWYKRRCLRQW